MPNQLAFAAETDHTNLKEGSAFNRIQHTRGLKLVGGFGPKVTTDSAAIVATDGRVGRTPFRITTTNEREVVMPTKPTVTAKMIMELIESQGFRCALSNRQLTPENASLDHVIPLSRGGTHDIENLCVVHHQVNTAKSSMTVDEFVTLCREVTECQDQSTSTVPA